MSMGVTIGKFMPLHLGHEFMLTFASQMVDKLIVLVSGNETDEIPLSVRYDWIKRFAVDKNILVVKHTDNSPTPVNIDKNGTVLDPEFQNYWKTEFSMYAPGATHFISSDMYGKTMADLLGISWIPVDPKREVVNISGTKIRRNPLMHFFYISEIAKPYFVKTVAIVGPESSGKSTLTAMLGSYSSATSVPEYGRTVSEIYPNLTQEDFDLIFKGQLALIDAAKKSGEAPIIITDTEAYTTALFAEYYDVYGGEYAEFAKTQAIDLYILLTPEVEWVDDGTRIISSYSERKAFYDKLLSFLVDNNKNFVIVDGSSFEDRHTQAFTAILKVLQGK